MTPASFRSTISPDDTIIIVGAGVIGLSTAYNLAKQNSGSASKPKIIVFDVFNRAFGGTSGSCSGCFHYNFSAAALVPLGKYSFDLWAAHRLDLAFFEPTGYRSQSSYGISQGTGQGVEKLPDWVRKDASWDVDDNPVGVGKWLANQCLEMGVHIITGIEFMGVILSSENMVRAVTYRRKDCQTQANMPCRQLLLACGPWTPTVFKTLFPSSPIDLHETTDAGDWVLFGNPCPELESRLRLAFVSFAGLVGEKLEFAARIDGTIWACGRRNMTASLPPVGQHQQPDEEVVKELRCQAEKLINWNCTCGCEHLQLVAKGRAFRPATKSGLPTISAVPASRLTDKEGSSGSDCAGGSSGVFVSWGHGSYGLTLGMGSGRLMSQLMRGEETDIDMSPFSLNC